MSGTFTSESASGDRNAFRGSVELRGFRYAIVSIVFFISGIAALIYQIAWQRLLTVHYGVGAISITLIVSVYMSGLGVGALAGGALVVEHSKRHLWPEELAGRQQLLDRRHGDTRITIYR